MSDLIALLRGSIAAASTAAGDDNHNGSGGSGSQDNWYLLKTKHRQERILARELAAIGLKCISPTATRLVRYGSVNASVERALCPDEAFLLGSDADAAIAKRSPRVTGCRRLTLSEVFQAVAVAGAAQPGDSLELGSEADVGQRKLHCPV